MMHAYSCGVLFFSFEIVMVNTNLFVFFHEYYVAYINETIYVCVFPICREYL